MKNIVTAALVGGAIIWIWGFIAWVVLPLHQSTLRPIPDEETIVSSLAASAQGKGVYQFPAMPREVPGMSPEAFDAEMERYMEKYRSGPVGLIFYDPSGKEAFMLPQMITGLLIFILAAGMVAWFLSRSTAAAGGYLSRVVYCGMIGVFIAVGTHLSEWNWLGFPGDWTTAQMIDSIIAWLLAGAGIAAVMKPKPAPAA